MTDGPAPRRFAAADRGLSLASRVREAAGRGSDRILEADRLWTVLFVFVLLLLLYDRPDVPFEIWQEGEVAPHDVVAPDDLLVIDVPATEARREAVRQAVPDVYAHDVDRGRRLAAELSALFEAGRADPRAVRGRVSPAAADALAAAGFSEDLERKLTASVRQALDGLVVGTRALMERESEVLVAHVPSGGEERLSDFGAVVDLDTARARIREEVAGLLPPDLAGREALADLAAQYLDANLTYDPETTEARRRAAAARVPPVRIRVREGTVLVKEGEPFTGAALARLEAVRDSALSGARGATLAGFAGVLALLAFFLYRYTRYHQRHFRKVRHLHALMILLMLSMILLAQAILAVAGVVADDVGTPFDQVDMYVYLVPLAGGAILVTLLANGRIAMVYSAFTALLFGILADWDAFRLTWALLAQWLGIYAISAYRERTALLRAGLIVGGAQAVLVFAVEALRGSLDPLSRTLFGAGLALAGGALGVGLLVSFALPVLERLFKVLTDVRLLELSNVNAPLLSELAMRAPGSYNHSLVVGLLAEEGAKAIGANALFCRVAALYHDIGKLRKPEYYVENQRGGNPHDRLTPSMSALVISAHVKDGIRLAREAGLPEQVVDIIPQHHGTRLMTFFFEKARRLAGPGQPAPAEEDFRYPGPRPQTREAAIFMLADAVEAAARTAEEPTPGRLKEVIRKVSNAIVLDGQLDECDLTFADLERVQGAFLRTLVSTHHHRVDYPGFDFGRPRAAARG